jgi:hypothetical protein
MRIILITLFYTTIIYGQNKIFVLSKSDVPISDVNIYYDSIYVQKTDLNGVFNINKDLNYKKIKLTHVGFKDFTANFVDIYKIQKIILTEKIEELETVELIQTKKIESLKLLPSPGVLERFKTFNNFNPSFGSQLCVHVKNTLNENYYINKIIISVKKTYNCPKETENLPFLVNLMSTDTISKLPLNKIFERDIIARKKNGEDYVEINLSKKEVFPSDGIFVFVEIPNPNFYNNYTIKNMYYTPSFELILHKNSKNINSYYRTYNYKLSEYSEWYENSKQSIPNFRFGIEIKKINYEK